MRKFRWIPKVIAAVCVIGILGLIVYVSTHNVRKSLYTELTREELIDWSQSSYENEWEQSEDTLGLSHMKKVASGNGLELYFHEKTCELAIKTSDGTVWYTNPQDRLAFNPTSRLSFASQVLVSVITSEEVVKTMYSFTDAVQYGQYVVTELDNGVRVDYRFGKLKKIQIYPEGLTEERYNEILAQLDAADSTGKSSKGLAQYYSRVDASTLTGIALSNTKERFSKVEELGVVYALKTNPSPLIQKKLLGYFNSIGYTMDDREQDHDSVGYADELKNTNNVLIPVTYTLEDGTFRTRVLTEEIKAAPNLKIQNVTVLPYLNNGEVDTSEVLTPDGEGSVLKLGTIVSSSTAAYEETVYGVDNAVYKTGSTSTRQPLSFPFYGLMNSRGALYATVEQSAATASLRVMPRTGQYEYGSAGFKFKILEFANTKLMADDKDTVRSYADRANLEPIEVAYRFLPQTQSSWMDLAKAYREELRENGTLSALSAAQVPTVLNLIGAIDDVEPFLGIPREIIVPLTTYAQAEQIAQEMHEALGETQLAIRYTGWQKGGIQTAAANKVRLEGALGGSGDFTQLVQWCRDNGVGLFPDTDFQNVYRTRLFDGYSRTDDAARFVLSETAYRADYNKANFLADPDKLFGTVLNPSSTLKFAASYVPSAQKYGLSGLSLTYFGTELNSDFTRDHFVTRNRSQELAAETLKTLRDGDLRLMIAGSNLYTLPYAEIAVNIPMQANAHTLVSRQVPFVQTVLSGSVTYTADPINRAADKQYYKLKCIETGSGLYADLMAGDNALVKGTKYDDYYAAQYGTLKDEVSAIANEIAEALAPVYGHEIVGYEEYGDGLVQVSYDNGKAIVLNFATEAQTTPAGVTVEAMGWAHTTGR